MLLTIDVGNTNLTIGLYESDKLGARWRLATDHERMPDEYGLQSSTFSNTAAVLLLSWTASVFPRLYRRLPAGL